MLCEKPMTMVAEEFDTLIAKRDATGCCGERIVHHPQWQWRASWWPGGDWTAM